MSLTFEQPLWLLVAALAVPAGVTGFSWFGTMSRARVWSSIVLRVILLALIAGILAGASAVRMSDRIGVIAVVDVSDSARQFARTAGGDELRGRYGETLQWWIREAMRDPRRRPDDLLGVVVFDGQAIVAATPRPLGPREAPGAGPTAGGGAAASGSAADFTLDWKIADGTNIEDGLRLAAASFPPDAVRRIVLISDGVETAGDSLSAARELAGAPSAARASATGPGAGVRAVPLRIDALPLPYRVQDETMVEAVDVPPQAAAGSTIAVRVSLLATRASVGTLELSYEDRPLDLNGPATPGTGRPVTLRAGRNIIEVPVRLDEARTLHRLRPIFIPSGPGADSIASNNAADAFTITPGKGRVLVIDGVGDARPGSPGLTLVRALVQAGIDATPLSPAEAPIDVLSLQAYDLVILENVAAEEIPRAGHKAMADFVTELGGGLVMVGGPDSFGAGGWKGTDLEPILPVRLDLSEQLLAPSAAVVLVIDNSGSMNQRVMGGQRSQQEIANEGAALAVETLDKTDFVAVVAFNSAYSLVVPMDRNTDARLSAERVRAIGTGGGTNLYPALDYAGTLLASGEASKASVRHVIILSDGRSEGNPEDGVAIARELRRRGITVSSIAVGDGADGETLAAIAREGGGQYYEVIDPHTLPRVFVREIRVVRKPLIRETLFRPVDARSGSRLLAGLPAGAIPSLRGLVLTRRRDDPKVNTALVTPEGEPLLAHWFAGRGQTAAFTSDAHDWARDWLPWAGYAALWTQIARTIARPATEDSSELSTQIVDGELRIRLDAADEEGRPRDYLSVPGTVFDPHGQAVPIRLAQTGPGVYEARVPAPDQGNYVVALTPRGAGADQGVDSRGGAGHGGGGTIVGGASRALGEEFRSLQSNVGLLRQIAQETGGRLLDLDRPEEAGLYSREGVEPVRAAASIVRALLIWAVVIFLLDVGTRRIAWDSLLTREVLAALREQALATAQARSARAVATLAALRSPTPPIPTPTPTATPDIRPAPQSPTFARGTPEAAPSEAPSTERPRRGPITVGGPEAPEVEWLTPVRMDEKAQSERRARLRAQMLERMAAQRSTPPPTPSTPPPKASSNPSTPDSASPSHTETPEEASSAAGLLEAKRRAREHYTRDHPDSTSG